MAKRPKTAAAASDARPATIEPDALYCVRFAKAVPDGSAGHYRPGPEYQMRGRLVLKLGDDVFTSVKAAD